MTVVLDGTFKKDQLRYERVRNAYAEKEAVVDALLKPHGIERGNMEVFFRALKKELRFQVFARTKGTGKYKLIKEYELCVLAGDLGPKRKQGDWQVPEGFYYIDRYNPVSSYHLSLGINYPNASDRKLGTSGNLGGDIFIHGDCVSIGCIPLTDPLIREVYIFALEAHDQGQKRVPVHIFPFDFGEVPKSEWGGDAAMHAFWSNLEKGFQAFEDAGTVPSFTVDAKGKYVF